MKRNFKAVCSVLMILLLVFVCFVPAFAATLKNDAVLQVKEDGTFKICMFNDLQDNKKPHSRTIALMDAVLDSEQPDLVVIVGDTLSDRNATASVNSIEATLKNLLKPIADRTIPFLFTFGNHDHEVTDILSLEDMIAVCKSFESCVIPEEVCDPGTYNVPVLNSDATGYAFNVYMMDTGNKNEIEGGYRGVIPEQVDWYKATADALKADNGGKIVPSLLFQHIPVKEIYGLLEETEDTKNAYFSTSDHKWYRLKEDKLVGDNNFCHEAPCSENLTVTTGQYEAWLEKGDIIGAFFGHDHINNFVGITDDGIKMGYNAGAGFATYGDKGNRSARIFVLNENDPAAYETYNVTYDEIMNKKTRFVFIDLFCYKTTNAVMRFLDPVIGWIFDLL
ncbi:MAG: metallophosphoesterase family protein [Clostridia bacterium]|nr:metallophosphoesterase family protein [Clostridia bacterium]